MNAHQFWVVVHILLLVWWLGTDLGVFYMSRFVLRTDLAVETRTTLTKIMLALDLAPRVCLVLTLPVGLTLAADLALSPVRGGWLAAAWIVALTWLGAVLIIYRERSGLSETLRLADLGFRLALVAALGGAGAVSIITGRPFGANWLVAKVLLFSLIVALGVGIRLTMRPFVAGLSRLVREGSHPATEAMLATGLRRTYPLVLGIWAALVAAAVLGVVQP